MRVSTLLEWSVLIAVFIVALLALQWIVTMAVAGPPLLTARDDPGTAQGCADLGGFYQDPIGSESPISRQVGTVAFTLQPLYRYRIVGKVVGKDEYSASPLDQLGPMDLTIANGDVIRPEILSHVTIRKYPRHFTFQYFFPAGTDPLSSQYVNEHISNNHLIFADDSAYSVAKSVDIGDMVEISGYLVSVSGKGSDRSTYTWTTSTTRSDMGEHACEIVYVTSFRKYVC